MNEDRKMNAPFREADIQINGWQMTTAQAMTIRVALEIFASTLTDGELGDEDNGRWLNAAYLGWIREIRLRSKTACRPTTTSIEESPP